MSGLMLPHEPQIDVLAREPNGRLASLAARFCDLSDRFVPDAFVFALLATIACIILAVTMGHAGPGAVIDAWGQGFWTLLPFTLQMAMVVITGYVLATARPVHALIERVAALTHNPRMAVVVVAVFAMLSSWLNWGFSLIFSAMLAKEFARRIARVDYRALAAASLLGLGSVWAQGLSGSAALQMATASALPAAVRTIIAKDGTVPGGIVPLASTVFLWQSLASVAIEIIVVALLAYAMTPSAARAKSAHDLGIALGAAPTNSPRYSVYDTHLVPLRGFAAKLEHSRVLSLSIVAVGFTYLFRYLGSGVGLAGLDLNTLNLAFLLCGILLHGTPARLMQAVREAVPSVWGIILQFPFYAGIAAIMTKTQLSASIAHAFVAVSTPRTLPALVAIYSAVLGIFVPSGGSKWVIEAPYVMQAAHDSHVHLGWMVAAYDLGEALANLVQPFWMLPVLGLFRLKARDVMGFTFLVFLVLLPLVLVLVTVLGATLPYPL